MYDDEMKQAARELELACEQVWRCKVVYCMVLNGTRVVRFQMDSRPIPEQAGELTVRQICETPERDVVRLSLPDVVDPLNAPHGSSVLSPEHIAAALQGEMPRKAP